jgi:hypothetical protein
MIRFHHILALSIIAVFLSACGSGEIADPSGVQGTGSATADAEPAAATAEANVSDPAPAAISTATERSSTPLPTNTPPPTFTPQAFGEIPSIFGMELTGRIITNKVLAAQVGGATWIRRNGIFWDQIEPVQGQRNWSLLADFEMGLAEIGAAGQTVIVIVRGVPAWAALYPETTCGPIAPDKLDDFADFMSELVSRYSQPPFNVNYWELGNEPDVDYRLVPGDSPFGCWGDRKEDFYGAHIYAEMLEVVTPAIKQADPDAQVLIGGLLLDCDPENPPIVNDKVKNCEPSDYLEGLLRAGAGPYFDGISFHAYDFFRPDTNLYANGNWGSGVEGQGLIPVIQQKTRFLRRVLLQFGFPEKYLINTETALLCGNDLDEPYCATDEFHHTKAAYAVQSNAVAVAEGLRANIWYHLARGWRASGLLQNAANYYPAYFSYQFSTVQLNDAFFWGQYAEVDGVIGYKFIREREGVRQEMWIVWSLDGQEHRINVDRQPDDALDMFGEPLSSGTEFEVTIAPIYLIWSDN